MVDALTAIGPTATTPVPHASGSGATLNKNDFLKLLVTQLQNQDPLNPMDQNQFLSQTAQFTSLEQLQNINTGIDALRQNSGTATLGQNAALLGRTVRAAGRDFTWDGTAPATLPFALEGGAGTVQVDIVDAQGTTVQRLTTNSIQPGLSAVTWDGRDSAGRPVAAGTYTYRVSTVGGGDGGPQASAAVGAVTGLVTSGGRLTYQIGGVSVHPEDIVNVQ